MKLMPSSKDTQMMGDQNRFPTTSWNLVRTAKKVEALDTLIQVYWKPLYFFVRQHGYDNETSKDMVQGFLTTLMQRDAFSKADPARGRFRTFLLAALSNFIKDCAKAETRLKRGGDQAIEGESNLQKHPAAGHRHIVGHRRSPIAARHARRNGVVRRPIRHRAARGSPPFARRARSRRP